MSTSDPDNQATGDAGSAAAPEGIDPQTLLRELATSVALLPQEAPPEGQETPEGSIALPVIEQDGKQYIPVFTSEEALRAAGADAETALRLPLAQLAASWPGEDLWLAVNPASENGLTLPPEVVRSLPGYLGEPNGTGDAASGQVQPD
jgi:SseB protein N-terminal domain